MAFTTLSPGAIRVTLNRVPRSLGTCEPCEPVISRTQPFGQTRATIRGTRASGMLQTDEQWLSIADEFYCAAVDHRRWYGALEQLAAATGSRCGELIMIGRDAVLPVHIMTNIDPAILAASDECRIGDPAINPRVK